jgi:protocatechuate 3,4-dioxygenase alpha subunit
MTGLTPSQTVGPFFAVGLPYEGGEQLVPPDDPHAIRIAGTVLDGAGQPVPDGLVELWQANRAGRLCHPEDRREELPLDPDFAGFGRCPTDAGGGFEFVTVKPGTVPPCAPHINVCVFARGLLRQLVTRIYFPDEPEANAADPLLSSIEDPALRASLIARAEGGDLRFDIHLQGERETAFLDV